MWSDTEAKRIMDNTETEMYAQERLINIKEPNSPGWIKPAEVLCIRRKMKKASSTVLKNLNQNSNVEKSVTSGFHCIGKEKSVNPFKCKVNKNCLANTFHPKENSTVWHWLPDLNLLENTESPAPVVPSVVDENAQLGFTEEKNHFFYSESKKQLSSRSWQKHLPVDWSLKTRVRFLSPKPFPWRGSLKTAEEASGTTGFVRCIHADQNGKQECNLDSSHGARFYQQTLFWMHPSLPWLKLFPRMDSTYLKKGSSNSPFPNDTLEETLHSDWCTSFCSLFQMVRARQCPFFYLCAPTFTVLFQAAGISGSLDIHALIAPTSRGLRHALKEEGIEFTMPLNPANSSDSFNENTHDENSLSSVVNEELQVPSEADMRWKNEHKESDDCTEEPGIWLESMGLSQEDFPSLHPKRPRLNMQKRIDNQPQSLVYLEGSETQALLNFLLNSKMCVSKTGPLAGVPPTLLSPTSFNGATLRSLKVKQGGLVKYQKEDAYAIELSGPILPSAIHGLCSLLNVTQEGHFTAVLATHLPTSSFASVASSCFSGVPSLFATENLKDCGLPTHFVQNMCSKNADIKGSLNEIVVEKGLFFWN